MVKTAEETGHGRDTYFSRKLQFLSNPEPAGPGAGLFNMSSRGIRSVCWKVENRNNGGCPHYVLGWSLPGTLIHGSRKKTETFYATESGTIMAGFARNEVVVPANNQYVTYNISGTLNVGPHPRNNGLVRHFVHPDQVATLSGSSTTFTRPMWVAQPTIGGAAPSHNRTNPSRVRSLPYGHISSVSPLEKQKSISLTGSKGGELWGSANPYNIGRFLGSVTSAIGGQVRIDARPHAGYGFVKFSIKGPSLYSGVGSTDYQGPTTTYAIAGQTSSVSGAFKEKLEYELTLVLAGDDAPCSGHVIAEPAMKYYPEGAEVTIEAHPMGACCEALDLQAPYTVSWSGNGSAYDGFGGDYKALSECSSTLLYIEMDSDRTIKAEFKRLD